MQNTWHCALLPAGTQVLTELTATEIKRILSRKLRNEDFFQLYSAVDFKQGTMTTTFAFQKAVLRWVGSRWEGGRQCQRCYNLGVEYSGSVASLFLRFIRLWS